MYLNVKRGCGVSYHQERLWCIVMLETVMVYRNVRGSCGAFNIRSCGVS
jgi:hypothetical protein